MATERNCEAIGYKSAKYRPESATIQNLKFENFGKFSFFAKGTFLALKLSIFGFGRDKKFWQQMRSYVTQSAINRLIIGHNHPQIKFENFKNFKIFEIFRFDLWVIMADN